MFIAKEGLVFKMEVVVPVRVKGLHLLSFVESLGRDTLIVASRMQDLRLLRTTALRY